MTFVNEEDFALIFTGNVLTQIFFCILEVQSKLKKMVFVCNKF